MNKIARVYDIFDEIYSATSTFLPNSAAHAIASFLHPERKNTSFLGPMQIFSQSDVTRWIDHFVKEKENIRMIGYTVSRPSVLTSIALVLKPGSNAQTMNLRIRDKKFRISVPDTNKLMIRELALPTYVEVQRKDIVILESRYPIPLIELTGNVDFIEMYMSRHLTIDLHQCFIYSKHPGLQFRGYRL